MYIYCYINSPIHIQDEITCLIPPITYCEKIYVIKERTLSEILIKIGLFKEFIIYTRKKGYQYTKKWLSSKGLLNEGFLESVSQYWIDNAGFKISDNYESFSKDFHQNPIISRDYLRKLFHKAILYTYIKERKEEFNILVEKELDFIEKELSLIKNENNYYLRQNYYEKNILKYILDNFLINAPQDLTENIQSLESLNINLETNLDSSNLSVCKIGNLSGYKNSRFQTDNISLKECLKKNTLIKFYLSNNKSISYMDLLFESVRDLTKDKLQFEKSYITKLLLDNNTKYMSIINTLSSINSSIIYSEDNDEQENSDKKNIAILEKNKGLLYQENHIISHYDNINDSNLLICSINDLDKSILLLNMSKSSIARLNKLIYNKENAVESSIVKVNLERRNIPDSPSGFASFLYNS